MPRETPRPRALMHALGWLALAVAGAVLLAWAYPRTYPLLPRDWTTSRDEAVTIALERLRDLGEPVEEPYVITQLDKDEVLEKRLRPVVAALDPRDPGSARLLGSVLAWQVTVYRPGARGGEWTYRARVAPSGQVLALELQLPEDAEGEAVDPASARRTADAFLRRQGFDLSRFEEPEVRSVELAARTDLSLRYRDRSRVLGEEVPYGMEVSFAGERLAGFSTWYDDPDATAVGASFQGLVLLALGWRLLPMLLVPVVGVLFLRRYHAGEVGVRRGLQIFTVALVFSLLFLAMGARSISAGISLGPLSQQQGTVAIAVQVFIGYFGPIAALAFLCWTVGEVLCRERAPHRLAAFDALLKGRWANATVARASLQGVAAGLGLAALAVVVPLLLGSLGAWAPLAVVTGPWWDGVSWFGIAVLAFIIPMVLYIELFSRLLLTSAAVGRLGLWAGGAVAAVVGGLTVFPDVVLMPISWALPLWIALAGLHVVLFLRYGLATALLASLSSTVLLAVYPFLLAQDPWMQLQAAIPLFVVALPLLVSARHLTSGRELDYRYDDVPPHVRRIAERERQRVELETARGIQSSILPQLPPQLNGVELAHAYLPATEVGGDFYDVLALEDGRLAVAVGDVAGHGVSSGLVMSMAKSALAVQVTFNPEVEAVFSTLNRVVYQSARKRLLATLCYALLDPARRELLYASAGHLYPYVITAGGEVSPLEYTAYPLGVRDQMTVDARMTRLAAGDTLFLLSDGLVEARPEASDEMFGFQRLEESLRRHAGLGVSGLRDAVLRDVEAHTRGAPREDDQTVLVLRVP